MAPMDQSFMAFVEVLRAEGELVTLPGELSSEGDLAAVLALLEAGPAVHLPRVDGSGFGVVGNILNSRRRMAAGLGVGEPHLVRRLVEGIRRPIATTLEDDAPWMANIGLPNLRTLPIPTFFERETGRYISAGVIFARDSVTGARNASYARFKVLDDRTMMLGVSPNHHLGRIVRSSAQQRKTQPISIAIGNHPAVMLAACLYLGFGDDEAECAGRLMGEPLRVSESPTHGISVPWGSDLIIDATVDGQDLVQEGPVSEYHGLYHEYGSGYVCRVESIAFREDPLFQVILPGLYQEHILLGAVAIAAGLQERLQALFPKVVDVAVPQAAAGRTAAVVSLDQPVPGLAMQVILSTLGAVPLIKQVTVVDADIDVWNALAVDWAKMTRMRADRDVIIIPNCRTDRSEPLEVDGTVTKLGIDATMKSKDRVEGFGLSRLPSSALSHGRALLKDAGLAEAPSELMQGLKGFQ